MSRKRIIEPSLNCRDKRICISELVETRKSQMAYRQMILDLIADSKRAKEEGVNLSEIRLGILFDKLQPFLKTSTDFLNWIREDREFSVYYYEAQQSGVCAKPNEIIASIIEAMVLDAIED